MNYPENASAILPVSENQLIQQVLQLQQYSLFHDITFDDDDAVTCDSKSHCQLGSYPFPALAVFRSWILLFFSHVVGAGVPAKNPLWGRAAGFKHPTRL